MVHPEVQRWESDTETRVQNFAVPGRVKKKKTKKKNRWMYEQTNIHINTDV